MVDILDIAPVIREVETHNLGTLTVTGLSISGIVSLIKSHPAILEVFDSESDAELDIDKIILLGEDVVAAFLAAGLGHPGEEKAIAKCKLINIDDSWKIAEAILDESFPGGAINFFERVAKAFKEMDLQNVLDTINQTAD